MAKVERYWIQEHTLTAIDECYGVDDDDCTCVLEVDDALLEKYKDALVEVWKLSRQIRKSLDNNYRELLALRKIIIEEL